MSFNIKKHTVMRLSINKIGWKVFIYHNTVIFLLFMCLYMIVPYRFEAYITKEKEASLKQLNGMLSRYGERYLNFSADSVNLAISFEEVFLPYYQINPDFRYMALIHANDDPSMPPFLYNIEIEEMKQFIAEKHNETVVSYNKPGIISVVTPIFGKLSSTETGETKVGYLIAGFSIEDQRRELKRVRYVLLIIWGLFMILGNLWAYYQYRFITIPVKKSSALIKDVVQGDLRGMIQSESRDELGSLVHSLNDMVQTWREKLSKIKTIIESSSAVSTEISIAASQQEKTTANQASSINQVATTIEELNATSKIVYKKAEAVEGKSIELLQGSLEGQNYVNRSIETFASIRENVENIAEYVLNLSEEAQQIGVILKEMSAIVTQTDMLAINAGIRAARVKEKGHQFTIIATELTDLASQSQVSADKVSTLIGQIQNSNQSTVIAMDQAIERVEGGIKLILKAGKTIENSIMNVNKTVDSVKGIAVSAHQQSLGTTQVNQSVMSINEGMQETAISSKQTLGETENLHKVNQELLQMIRYYKL
jgi:methyl-accepting chemotaxis protein